MSYIWLGLRGYLVGGWGYLVWLWGVCFPANLIVYVVASCMSFSPIVHHKASSQGSRLFFNILVSFDVAANCALHCLFVVYLCVLKHHIDGYFLCKVRGMSISLHICIHEYFSWVISHVVVEPPGTRRCTWGQLVPIYPTRFRTQIWRCCCNHEITPMSIFFTNRNII